ncbi:hypothetical protein Cgig2_001715 [Carnegiea gigantea]|uniref:Uncharacterized protein n=1 Tax=Carnegiea gigantea TaxID=171969 RepID=A0A9Q1Q7U9_9CARY|nr:hypothetical protein Cgig2_001715 [Carnegiea gigantea]
MTELNGTEPPQEPVMLYVEEMIEKISRHSLVPSPMLNQHGIAPITQLATPTTTYMAFLRVTVLGMEMCIAQSYQSGVLNVQLVYQGLTNNFLFCWLLVGWSHYRKHLVFISSLVMSFTTLASAFSPNVWVHSFFEFISGLAIEGWKEVARANGVVRFCWLDIRDVILNNYSLSDLEFLMENPLSWDFHSCNNLLYSNTLFTL